LPSYLLTHEQIHTVLGMTGIGVGAGSPLAALPEASRILQPADAAFQKMADGHLLEAQDGSWRVNTLVKAVLLACAKPEEVLAFRVMGPERTGFSVCRRGPLLSECTVGGPDLTKTSFPLTRSAIILMLTSALSSDRPEPPPTGFRFQGRADDAFVLSLLLNEARANPVGLPATQIAETVAKAVENPSLTLPFVLIAGAQPLLALAYSGDAVAAVVGRLTTSGHVRNEGGWLTPSRAALEALSAPPAAGFAVSRTLVGPDGPASHTLEVARSGERSIVFRKLRGDEGQPLLEWSEVSRAQLRALVAATLMDERELAAAGAAETTTPAPTPPPAAEARSVCPNCNADVQPGQRFCRACGYNLTEGKA